MARAQRLQLGKPQSNREKHLQNGIWDLVRLASTSLFNIVRTVTLRDVVRHTPESASTGTRDASKCTYVYAKHWAPSARHFSSHLLLLVFGAAAKF